MKKLFLLLAFIFYMKTALPENPVFHKPEEYLFEDDGFIPNSKLPVLVYRSVFNEKRGDKFLIQTFAKNNWKNSWDNGIYSFHHYHSTSHEVLGIYNGEAEVQLGGEQGKIVKVKAGDVIVIPAGVGHKKITSKNLGVIGAYPNGMSYDLMKGKKEERPKADQNIQKVPVPKTDPIFGDQYGLTKIWGN
jgi:uncharacterized protein YjlB